MGKCEFWVDRDRRCKQPALGMNGLCPDHFKVWRDTGRRGND